MSNQPSSRRRFLKAVGATAVTLAAGRVAIPAPIAAAAITDRDDFQTALDVANKSSELQQLLQQAESQGFKFDLARGSLVRNDTEPKYVGLAIAPVSRPQVDTSIDLMVGINLESQTVAAISSLHTSTQGEQIQFERSVVHIADPQRSYAETSTARVDSARHEVVALSADEEQALNAKQALPVDQEGLVARGLPAKQNSMACASNWKECTGWSSPYCASWVYCGGGLSICTYNQQSRQCRNVTVNQTTCAVSYGSWYNDYNTWYTGGHC